MDFKSLLAKTFTVNNTAIFLTGIASSFITLWVTKRIEKKNED